MSQLLSNNKRLIKNTLYLYVRMAMIMAVSLYTSRVVLDKLGFVDFGIYNVVFGFALMFGFFQSSLANATQRFIKVALSQGDVKKTQQIFSQSFIIYLLMIALVLIVAETFGVWFVNHKLTIPAECRECTFLVFQFALISVVFTILGTAYESVLIAREDMKIYSILGMVEAFLKLITAYLIIVSSFNRLALYAFLLALISGFKFLTTFLYCFAHYKESHFEFEKDKANFRELFSFIGWNTYGSIANIACNVGVDVLMNVFFGPVVNASKAIAGQLNNAVMKFTVGFLTAARPQIVGYYAKNEISNFKELVFASSKLSVLLAGFFVIPGFFFADYLLSLWLVDVPQFAVLFTRWTLLICLVSTLSASVLSAAQAVGNLKSFYLYTASTYLVSVPAIYVLYLKDVEPVCAYVVLFATQLIGVLVGIWRISKSVEGFFLSFCERVVWRLIAFETLFFVFCSKIVDVVSFSMKGLILFCLMIVVPKIFLFYIVCLNSKERAYVEFFVKERLRK